MQFLGSQFQTTPWRGISVALVGVRCRKAHQEFVRRLERGQAEQKAGDLSTAVVVVQYTLR